MIKMNKFTLSSFDNISVNVIFTYIEKNNCYNIKFTYEFPDLLDTFEKKKIFMKSLDLYDKTTEYFYEGDIIQKNPMTVQLINLMMLNNENLNTHSGHVTSECYRLSLIQIIKLLWD